MAQVIVKLTKAALDDIDQITNFGSDKYIKKQLNLIYQKLDELKTVLGGRPIPELKDFNIRQVLAGNYRIIYHLVSSDFLVILRVYHAKRILDPESELNFEY
jgi:plasmid stabilization system protein ParE